MLIAVPVIGCQGGTRLTVTLPLPFRSSRPLARGNGLLGHAGVALDVVGIDLEDALHAAWQSRIERVGRCLGWPGIQFALRPGAAGVTLGFTAPDDQLETARQANEWALCAALQERDPGHWSALREALRDAVFTAAAADPERPCVLAEIEEAAALERLARLSAAESLASQRA